MTVAAHTPGPWTAQQTDGKSYADEFSAWEVESLDPADPWVVAAVITDVAAVREAGEANARLIAAAPDLLRELSYLVEWLDENRRTIDGEFSMDELLADPRAAIAKALPAQPRDQQSAGDKSREEP